MSQEKSKLLFCRGSHIVTCWTNYGFPIFGFTKHLALPGKRANINLYIGRIFHWDELKAKVDFKANVLFNEFFAPWILLNTSLIEKGENFGTHPLPKSFPLVYIPHICHFFTQAKFLENKIYTEKTRKLRQITQ